MNAIDRTLRLITENSTYGKSIIITYNDFSIIRYGANHYFRRCRSGFWYENEPFLTLGLDGIE